jgi:hypothetical protein
MLKFNFVIEYKERWRNTVADALSRRHTAAPICVITRSGRRTGEDNSLPHSEEQKKKKRRNKIPQTRTTERFGVERS